MGLQYLLTIENELFAYCYLYIGYLFFSPTYLSTLYIKRLLQLPLHTLTIRLYTLILTLLNFQLQTG